VRSLHVELFVGGIVGVVVTSYNAEGCFFCLRFVETWLRCPLTFWVRWGVFVIF